MKLFLSWSGDRSQRLAEALKEWLPLALHYVEPWVSKSDINAGERWATEVGRELEASNFGIICITAENVASPWILFESGALSKSMQEGRVVPLLLDLEFREIAGPLAQFQSKKVEQEGIWDLVLAINSRSQSPVPEDRLRQLFNMLIAEFITAIQAVPKSVRPAPPNRPQHEVLEELVTSVRGLDGRLRELVEETALRRRQPEALQAQIGALSDRLSSLETRDVRASAWSKFEDERSTERIEAGGRASTSKEKEGAIQIIVTPRENMQSTKFHDLVEKHVQSFFGKVINIRSTGSQHAFVVPIEQISDAQKFREEMAQVGLKVTLSPS